MAEGGRNERRAIELLQEAKQLLESMLSKQPSANIGNESLIAQSVVPNSSRAFTSVGFHEHRRLFGFNPSSAAYPSRKRSKESGISKPKNKKGKQRPTWTRTLVCLVDKDAQKSPTPSEYRVLKAANLGGQKQLGSSQTSQLSRFRRVKHDFKPLLVSRACFYTTSYWLTCGLADLRQWRV